MTSFFIIGIFFLCLQTNLALRCNEDIVPKYVNNLEEIVGNWTHLYHFDKVDHDYDNTIPLELESVTCAKVEISLADKDYVEAIKAGCGEIYVPFNWDDAKLKIIAPELYIFHTLITVGVEQYVMESCGKCSVFEVLNLNDNYILLVNASENIMELLGKKKPTREELGCLVEKLEKAKYFEYVAGTAYCFQ